jgi:DNA-directed RNA polymerase subunit L
MSKKLQKKYISNIKIDDNEIITFDLNNDSNDIKTGFANAIRRTIISEIKTYNIDDRTVSFTENTSVLDNEFLKLRLSLIPIVSDLEGVNYEDLVISCSKTNEGENTESIYVSDFICRDVKNDKVIDINSLCKYPAILFCKIRSNQTVLFEGRLAYHNSDHHGASYCPVGTCVYTFKVDEEKVNEITKDLSEIEKISFSTLERERIYGKKEDGHPSVYQFVIESIGFYHPLKVVLLGLNCLKDNLNILKDDFNKMLLENNSNEHRIELIETTNNDFFDFLIDNETETLGNLLTSYITYHPNVFYCGYVINHPLKKNINIRIKLIDNNTFENVVLLIIKYIDYFIDIINNIYTEFESHK